MLRNTPAGWGSGAKALHWVTVLLICAAVPAGYLMGYTYPLSLRDKLGLAVHQFAGQIHHTVGFLILALTLLRLAWRLFGPVPAAAGVFRFQGPMSRITQYALCAALIGLPVSGWLALSVFGAPIWFLDRGDIVPAIAPRLPPDDPHGYGFFAAIHVWLLTLGAALLALHVTAALWHHFVRRDDTLRRMWPLAALNVSPGPRPGGSPEIRSGDLQGP
jgi:cytochrome b561